uniref:Uncharacterized protein n=1 Tax=Anguilla anguilla TaxID=7936 RepID=A0A0E9WQM7_ANGAN
MICYTTVQATQVSYNVKIKIVSAINWKITSSQNKSIHEYYTVYKAYFTLNGLDLFRKSKTLSSLLWIGNYVPDNSLKNIHIFVVVLS